MNPIVSIVLLMGMIESILMRRIESFVCTVEYCIYSICHSWRNCIPHMCSIYLHIIFASRKSIWSRVWLWLHHRISIQQEGKRGGGRLILPKIEPN